MTPHKTYFKTPYFRSPEYLQWIRELRCAVCGETPCEPSHQRCLGNGGTALRPPDNEVLPACADCHRIGEHKNGIVTLWQTKRPEMWGDISDPLKGKLTCKQDLREWIAVQCEAYYRLWKNREKK